MHHDEMPPQPEIEDETQSQSLGERPKLTGSAPTKRNPIPKFQLFILLLIQFAEPMTALVIYPFVIQFVRDTAITGGDETKTGFYAGLLESSLVEGLTVDGTSGIFLLCIRGSHSLSIRQAVRCLWSPAGAAACTARVGTGHAGLWAVKVLLDALCLIVQAFRCAQGAFNGNLGVAKTVMNELMWSLGSTTSPFMGGTLANAASKWPDTLGKIELLHVHPYFLPCAVAASVAFTSFAFAFVGLRETLPSGVERERAKKKSKTNEPPRETDPLLPAETSATTGTSASASTHPDTVPPLRELFTRDVRIALLNHALLCFCDMAYDSLIPLVYSTPIAIGGLGLKPHNIGLIMGLCGFSNAVVQAAVGGRIIRHFGPRRVFNAAFCALACIFSLYPLLSVLARRAGRVDGAVVAVLVCQLSGNFVLYYSFAATMLFIMDSAPNRASVGSVTGLSQMVGTISRSVAPSITSSLFSLSVKHNLADGYLVYIFLAGISLYRGFAEYRMVGSFINNNVGVLLGGCTSGNITEILLKLCIKVWTTARTKKNGRIAIDIALVNRNIRNMDLGKGTGLGGPLGVNGLN
ncbi:major facilitator superfamily domain-containing protein [Mycena sp. CBHHK59/15]|nr:major facilitator superfamily domain-containing protein [Mycena sp. CBHHK59/15]